MRAKTVVSSISNKRSVLLLADSEDAREVLSTALSRRGIGVREVEEGGSHLGGNALPVDLILIDIESDGPEVGPIPRHMEQDVAQAKSAKMLILGSAHLPAADLSRAHIVSKPYHYGALLRKIEELLAAS